MIYQSDDARAYYAGGFRKSINGVPCKVFSRRLADGRYVNAKDSPFYDPEFDHPKTGRSRLEHRDEVEAVEMMGEAVMADAVAAEATCATETELRDIPAIAPEAPESPVQHVEAAEAAMEPPAMESAPLDVAGDEAAAMAAVGEYIGDMIRGLAARVAELEARLASPSAERTGDSATTDSPASVADFRHSASDSGEVDSHPLPPYPNARELAAAADGLRAAQRRTPARERLLRRYLAMRARRDLDRRALDAANAYVRKIEAERAKIVHQNEANVGLVTQLHDERLAHRRTRENAERRAAAMESAVDRLSAELLTVKGRATRAEQALQLYRRPSLPLLPYGGRSGAVARVSFGGGR
jgi:hypothetical protein